MNNPTTNPNPGPNDVFSNSPMLGLLGNFGGPTETLALPAGSPAIGAGNASANLPATDQRGLPRTVGGSLDIGAFQTQPPSIVFTTLGQTAAAGQPETVGVQLLDLDGNPVSAGSGGIVVSLSSSSSGGIFSNTNGSALSGSTITIPKGSSSATFQYVDTNAGSPTLTVTAPGYGLATQQETILPAPTTAAIVVGRTLSSDTTGDIQDGQVTIIYTIYNDEPGTVSGILLTDSLATGITLLNASQTPDQNGQNLAWSLGTL